MTNVTPAKPAVAAAPTARPSDPSELQVKVTGIEAAAALLLIRKAVIADDAIAQNLDLAA